VLRLVGQGGVAVGAKTGLASAAAVRRIERCCSAATGTTPPTTKTCPALCRRADPPDPPLRLAAAAAGRRAREDRRQQAALTAKGKKALSQPFHEVVKHLYDRWQLKGAPDELRRVDADQGPDQQGRSAHRAGGPAAGHRRRPDRLLPGRQMAVVDDLFRQMKVEATASRWPANLWKLYLADANYGSLGYDGSARLRGPGGALHPGLPVRVPGHAGPDRRRLLAALRARRTTPTIGAPTNFSS
jgi:hypothetical protein